MNTYEISYQEALDDKYQRQVRHGDDLWSGYFDRLGARVLREYGDPELDLGSDHLQNIADLIYSGHKHGIDEISIALDNSVVR